MKSRSQFGLFWCHPVLVSPEDPFDQHTCWRAWPFSSDDSGAFEQRVGEDLDPAMATKRQADGIGFGRA